jgi:hypothetical protein
MMKNNKRSGLHETASIPEIFIKYPGLCAGVDRVDDICASGQHHKVDF